jgi:hypothetical protein
MDMKCALGHSRAFDRFFSYFTLFFFGIDNQNCECLRACPTLLLPHVLTDKIGLNLPQIKSEIILQSRNTFTTMISNHLSAFIQLFAKANFVIVSSPWNSKECGKVNDLHEL